MPQYMSHSRRNDKDRSDDGSLNTGRMVPHTIVPLQGRTLRFPNTVIPEEHSHKTVPVPGMFHSYLGGRPLREY